MKHLQSALVLCAFGFALSAEAQTVEQQPQPVSFKQALAQIVTNNTTLKALQGDFESARLQNSADLCMPDPETEVTYAKGSPKGVPSRTNVSFTQSLDWGVLTGKRRKLAKANDALAHASYHVEAQKVMAEADEALVCLIYSNKLCAELQHRDRQAQELAKLYNRKFEQGDISQVELNKVNLNSAVSHAELQRAQTERMSALQNVRRLNGGVALELTDTVYPYADSPLPPLSEMQAAVVGGANVRAAEQVVAQNKAQAALTRVQGWPTFTVGFQGEYVKDNNYNGLSVGFTVPVWGSTRRQLKSAKSMVATSQLDVEDMKLQQSASLAQKYNAAVSLTESAERLRLQLQSTCNMDLLHRSLDEGQISLPDFLLDSSFYYTARTAQLEAERDAQLALSQLRGMLYDDCSE